MTLFIEGDVQDVQLPRGAELADLRAEIAQLRTALADANRETMRAKREAAQAVAALRQQLSPLYRALQAVFGELDAAGTDEDAPPADTSRTSKVWESWKSRLGGGSAKLIDALLLHREMNTQQLAIATGLHRNSIPRLIYSLNQAGLINKNGGRFSLKSLG